jgi:proteic killer suppression protein
VAIKTFKCPDTQKLFSGYAVRRWVPIERQALRKLEQLELSERLEDLRVPPGNRLEALWGKRRGQSSIRINDQWRLCFRWSVEGAYDLEIVDYH